MAQIGRVIRWVAQYLNLSGGEVILPSQVDVNPRTTIELMSATANITRHAVQEIVNSDVAFTWQPTALNLSERSEVYRIVRYILIEYLAGTNTIILRFRYRVPKDLNSPIIIGIMGGYAPGDTVAQWRWTNENSTPQGLVQFEPVILPGTSFEIDLEAPGLNGQIRFTVVYDELHVGCPIPGF